jgi:hypothetical protein
MNQADIADIVEFAARAAPPGTWIGTDLLGTTGPKPSHASTKPKLPDSLGLPGCGNRATTRVSRHWWGQLCPRLWVPAAAVLL